MEPLDETEPKADAMTWALNMILKFDKNPHGLLVHIDADRLQAIVGAVYDMGVDAGQIKEAKWTAAHKHMLAG